MRECPELCLIFEGADNVGKSTLIKKVIEKIENGDVSVIRQPSSNNIVGFLRKEVKENPTYNPLERQLLHTVTHLVDLCSSFNTSTPLVVMDRSPLSAFPYGKTLGLSEEEIELVYKVNILPYSAYFKQSKIKVIIVYINNDKPFQEDESEVYKNLNWETISNEYRQLMSGKSKVTLPSEWEVVPITNDDIEKASEKIIKIIQENSTTRTL